ncbi:MAG: EAL domain-containing protein [Firmicutes bacterium]|nr:EAL domain-containing protein [Bacillota bacterium]
MNMYNKFKNIIFNIKEKIKIYENNFKLNNKIKGRLVFDYSNDSLWEYNIKQKKYFFISKTRKILENSVHRKESDINWWKKLLHPDDSTKAIGKWENFLNNNRKIYRNIYRIHCKNEGYKWILSRGQGMYNKGKLIGISGSYIDITEKKELQNKLKKERTLNKKILNNASIIILMWDLNMNLVEFNKYAEKITGYKKKEILGDKWLYELIPKEEREPITNMFEEIKKGNIRLKVEEQLLCKNGKRIDVLWNNSLIYDKEKTFFLSMGIDITQQKKVEKQLYYMAHHDALTGLPNWNLFNIEFNKALNKKKSEKGALLYLDLDNFKNINDTLGHNAGDVLLKHISSKLSNYIKRPNIVARIGGDEFVIMLKDVFKTKDIKDKVNGILDLFNESFVIEGYEFFISLSVGIAKYPEHGQDITTLYKYADTAMFKAKESKGSKYNFFTLSIEKEMIENVELERELRKAIINKEFELYYQPQIDLKTGNIICVEALIRWKHPKKGFISPAKFIPFAEESGIISSITEWVLENAIRQKREWEKKGYRSVKLGINLSNKCFHMNNLVKKIDETIKKEEVLYEEIELEITETAAMDNIENSIRVLNKIKKLGMKIALDDFGIGYSSLNYLKKLPIDILKMDRAFIKNVTNEKEDKVITNSIIQLAHGLDITVVAEGIETKEQLEFLKNNKCDIGQGYLFSRPVSANEVEKYFKCS